MAASLVDCHSGNDLNDVKLCFVEDDDLLAKYANFAACDVIILTYPIISLFNIKVYFIYFLNMYASVGFVVNNEHNKHLC